MVVPLLLIALVAPSVICPEKVRHLSRPLILENVKICHVI